MVNPILFKSDKDSWQTPKSISTGVENLFCDGYLDPCPGEQDNPNLMKSYHPETFDGLKIDWKYDNVYMNPPYGRVIGQWTSKFQNEFEQGNFKNGIALIPGRLGAKWFQNFTQKSSCWCALNGRQKFVGAENSAPFPSVLVLYTTSLNFLNDFIDEYWDDGLFWKSI